VVLNRRACATGWIALISIVPGAKELCAAWLAERVRDLCGPPRDPSLYEAIGFVEDGRLVGAVMYTNYHALRDGTFDITMHAASERGKSSRRILRAIFSYPFNALNCSRVSAQAAKSNAKSREFLTRLGFKMEGVKVGGVARGRDAILYGMTKESCRWIK